LTREQQDVITGCKYRIYPTRRQKEAILKGFGCCRWIHNWAVDTKNKAYVETQKSPNCIALTNMLPDLKKDNPWLAEADSQALQQELRRVDNAFTAFFRKKADFPRFKSRRDRQSYSIPQRVRFDFEGGRVRIPKVGEVRAFMSKRIEGKTKTATVSMSATRKFFVSAVVDDGKPVPRKPKLDKSKAVGVDLGLKDFATLSTGERIPHPRTFRKHEAKLAKLQRIASRRKKGSNRRRKAALKVAKLHERVRNVRDDFLHKLSTRLVRENQAVCMENLGVRGMMGNRRLSKSIGDSGWAEFRRQVAYKCERHGRHFIEIGRFEPSSMMCGGCGAVNRSLGLSDRTWACPACGAELDRDVNAARNVLRFALQDQNLISPESEDFSPADCRSVPREGLRQGLR